ncbi:unnamed protein product [Dovyalis caffra]|uniref:RING-type E3 ubiquitin transferase n=1 Tax=Dovyalis caffra TaxID=77055 RepID=A0AAV1QRT9_9ROSI|nr:unnamed protein product [Dovyalis caffra]
MATTSDDTMSSNYNYRYWDFQQDHILFKYKKLVDDLPVSAKTKGFIMEFRYQEKLQRQYQPYNDTRLLHSSTELVYVKGRASHSKIAMEQILCPRLCLMGIPQEDHERLVQETLCSTSKHGYKKAAGPVPIVVEIVLFSVVKDKGQEEKVMDLSRERSMKNQRFKSVPVIGKYGRFVKGLKKVGLVYEDMDVCGICLQRLEDKLFGATWLPCSHAYHGSCIGKWFDTSPSCPTCRFQFTEGRSS